MLTCVLRLRQSMQRVQQTSTFRTCSDSMAYLALLSVIETRASRLSFSRRFFPDCVARSSSAQLTTPKQTGKVKERIELLVTFWELSSTIGRTIEATLFRTVSLPSMMCCRNRPRRLLLGSFMVGIPPVQRIC